MTNEGMDILRQADPDVFCAMTAELERQRTHIELIASENFVSPAVMAAAGSVMTNKYAEGYPEARYYGGCEHVDTVENLARERAKKIFGAEHANVQPHSGSQANMAVLFSVLQPRDTVLSMSLAHGGHLTHGSPKNFSGIFYNIVPYGVNSETERIDMNEVAELARTHKPKMIIAGASAYPRIIDFEAFGKIAKEVGAYLLVDMAHIAGLVATGLHPSPVPHADFVTFTTHKTMRGPRGGAILCKEQFAKGIDSLTFPGIQGGPLMHVIAGKAVAFKEAMEPSFVDYQKQVLANCQVLVGELVAAGYRMVSGGSDNHLFLMDLRSRKVSGRKASALLEEAGIIVNKNMIPNDPKPPNRTSGIRVGTPAVTTRGMREAEMKMIAGWMDRVLSNARNLEARPQVIKDVRKEVADLCERFKLYSNLK